MKINGTEARDSYNDLVINVKELRDSNGEPTRAVNAMCIAVEDEQKGHKWVGFVRLSINKRGQVILEISSNRDDGVVREKVAMDKLPLNPLLIPDEGGGGYPPKAKKVRKRTS